MELCTPCAKYIRRNQLAAHIGGRPHQRKLAALPRTLHVVEDVSGLPPAIPNGANDSGYAEHMESPPGCDWTGSSQDQVVDEGHGGVFVSGEQGVNLGDLERTTAVLPAAAPLFEEEEMLLSHEGTGITVSEEAGLRFGIIERAESGIYPSSTAKFIVTKENIQPLVTFVEARFSSEEGFSAALEGQSKYIKSNEPRTIVVTFLPPYEGSFEATIDLVFYDWARKGTFVVPRSVSGTAGTPHDHVLLAPRAMHVMPPARPRYKAPLHVNPYRPPTWTRGQSKGFGQYPLPPDWNGLLEDRGLDNRQYEEATARLLRAKLPGILKPETYAHHYRVLMNAEDAAQQRLLADNPPVEVTLTQRGDSFIVIISELEEDSLPEVILGDFLLLDNVREGHTWEARVHKVVTYEVSPPNGRRGHVEMKLTLSMCRDFRFERDRTFMLRPKLNRITIRRMYAAIDTYLASPQRLLFPTVRDILPRPTLDSGDRDRMDLHNAHILDDPEQLQAVHSVLHHPRGSVPFIIYGPPGTGKTATVVECILQLLIQNPDNRILACAPNNNACNVLTARLAAEPKLEGLMFRLHAFSRSVDDCPEDVQPFAFVNAHGVFGVPPLDILRKHRIVVCTCSSAAFLKSHGLPVGHFSHIIVDEAAQAEEPLAMVPIRAFADVLTNVVLAGDCNQLGPVIYSPAAGNLGLKKSYLERLMHFGETYDTKKQTGHTIVQLLRNRRSHGAIIAWSNKYLYEDTLCAAAHASTARNMLGSPLLPNKTFPVVFHGIKGKQMRGSKSPSWFNIEEASVVRNKCLALLEDKDRPIKEREIGVIAPYKAQVRRIRQLLKSSGIKDVLVCSVEQFQGEERRVIIFSTTRNTPPKGKEGQRVGVRAKIGFVNDRKRINVAFTRAQAMLIVIGDPEALGGHPIWRTFINYVASHGGATAKQPDWNLTTKVPVPGYVEIRVDERSRVGDEYIDKRSATVLRYMGD